MEFIILIHIFSMPKSNMLVTIIQNHIIINELHEMASGSINHDNYPLCLFASIPWTHSG